MENLDLSHRGEPPDVEAWHRRRVSVSSGGEECFGRCVELGSATASIHSARRRGCPRRWRRRPVGTHGHGRRVATEWHVHERVDLPECI